MSISDAKQTILERLNHDRETEMTSDELRELLDSELSKPADEINVKLVDDILAILDDYEPTAEEQRAQWNAIVQKIGDRQKQRRLTGIRRYASIAAIIIAALMIFTFGTAQAFRWTFLLKWLEPLAETFGIHSESQIDDSNPGPGSLATVETSFSQIEYSSLEEMPAELDGYGIVPGWVPERFAFVQGSVYQDDNHDVAYIVFTANEHWLSFSMTVFHSEYQSLDYEFEKTTEGYDTITCRGLDITVYTNSDDNTLSASWIDRDAHYTVTGSITEEELKRIIESL